MQPAAESAGLEGLEAEARALLAPLLGLLSTEDRLALSAGLRPRASDFALVFVPPVAELARRAYEEIWESPPLIIPQPGQTELRVTVVRAASFSPRAPAGFPRGYAQVAHLLQPSGTWAAWRFVESGCERGLAFDGLVHRDGRWAWFPKPFRTLGVVAQPHLHYVD